ncbi:unnamed protein product [Symbiodinium pilosum]|uniref:Uncharacterized protein n=1 Tax=Symbiodinium pilosum TaxID=2952 RepID=A0A812WI11_SYMPI|nr:unnamed protein product [Symbiodinium pilosum]
MASTSSSAASKEPVYFRLPLSEKELDLKAANKILSSAQTREKFLKILQYGSKLLSYFLLRSGNEWGKHFESLSKNLSTARRFFKLMRTSSALQDRCRPYRMTQGALKEKNARCVPVSCFSLAVVAERRLRYGLRAPVASHSLCFLKEISLPMPGMMFFHARTGFGPDLHTTAHKNFEYGVSRRTGPANRRTGNGPPAPLRSAG